MELYIRRLDLSREIFPFLWQRPKNNKNAAGIGSVIISQGNQMALSTLLERRHLVQAYTWQGVPLTTALTRFTLGFQARLERLWEWETLIPKVTPLPQKSHFAIHCTSHLNDHSMNYASCRRFDIIPNIFKKSKRYFTKNPFFYPPPGTAAINCCLQH